MLNVLRPLLLIAALTAVAPVHAQAQAPRVQGDEAGARVRQVERDGGRVLQAQPMQRGGEEVYRLKVLTPEGRVRVIQGSPSGRSRTGDESPARQRDSGARPPQSTRGLTRDRNDHVRERRAVDSGRNDGGPARSGGEPRRE
jgi:hypothetical protein